MTRPPERVVTVWCPHWPLTAAGLAPDRPAIVVRANRVTACSPAAADSGVAVGQRRRDAQRRCPQAEVVAHDPERDARAFEPVIEAVGELVPRCEVVEPGWASFGARGPSRYFGGDHRLAARVVDAIARAGHAAWLGVADGRFASAIAARRADEGPVVIPAGGSGGFLDPLPTAWLGALGEVDTDTVELWGRLGLRRLGDLAALPAAAMVDRFGPTGRRARLLAGGEDPRVVLGRATDEPRSAEHHFDTPCDQLDTITFVAKGLADRLDATLAASGQVCTQLVVIAETEHGERTERAWYQASGLRADAMVDRARWQLGAWVGTGRLTAGVVLVRLEIDDSRPAAGEQQELWGAPTASDESASRAVARLVNLVGDDSVLVARWHGGHLPADRYRWVPATLTEPPARSTPPQADQPWPGALPAPSPTVVHPTPIPVDLLDDAATPVVVSGRGELSALPTTLVRHPGQPREVARWAGPWPLDTSWWAPAHRRRAARLQVVLADGDAHLLFAEHRRWWITATY